MMGTQGSSWTLILRFVLFLLPAHGGAAAPSEDTWMGIERVVAVGDLHGDYDQCVKVLRSAGLIDERGAWTGGKTHLVQTGDVLDRGPDSRKAMDLLMRLEGEARAAGGEVHALLGNHEAMNVYGDLRYVSPGEYAAFRDANSEKARDALYAEHQKELQASLPPGRVPKFDDTYRRHWDSEHPLGYAEHRRAFGPEGTYGKWIRRHNAVIRVNGILFLHGGISPAYLNRSVREMNELIRGELEDFAKLKGGIAMDPEGPLWYRGLAQDDEKLLGAHVESVLKAFDVQRVAIGHTFTEGAVVPRFGGKVLMIDVGLSKVYDPRGRMACLVLEKEKASILHRGKPLELPTDSGKDLLRYFKEAAALDPTPSPLGRRIAELETRLGEPGRK
ncbi:MAG TPA: metallophosphoesterase [Planctomycetota bacterium]|nr:metallophosphoesterase [Planctomycetota bacterium]